MKRRGALALAALLLAGCSGCSGGTAAICSGPTPGVDQCVMPRVASELAAGASYPKAVADAAYLCGSDEASVGTIWAAWTQAAVIQGFVPRPIVGGDP